MGAMLGYFFGSMVHNLFPEMTATPGAYALVAMTGLVAGTTRAPITAIIIVFELTNDYRIVLPLMITGIISTIISSKLSRESIYTLKLVLRNIGIKEGFETNLMESIFIKNVFRKEFDTITITDNFSQVVNHIIRAQEADFPVVNVRGRVAGMISIYDIKDYLFEKESLENVLIAGDIFNPNFEPVTVDENCQSALDKMQKYGFEGLPVVDSLMSKKIIGMIWRKDILDAYQKETERREITASLASSINMKDETTQIHFMEGYSINEILSPKSFKGKSIRELNIRQRFGVDVLSIKTKEKYGEKINAIPSPDYIIQPEDKLIVAGEIKNINYLKNVE